ncbi:MAG TPA: bifunctional riboflavin kinase/FAD synthetase [Candidatus Cloacimonadota bacterium]|nr:bifunctional riboflavin kinase/FAD synthetase [Candidatus Cloacimonadota bacterium]HQB41009.1 bifunctional riboflavin kinase/FAD synthetase [Candidatus Cloacimonadota bacterium]
MIKNEKNKIITIGTFDGIHLGHQALISNLIEHAKKEQKTSLVLTYKQHPLETLRSDLEPFILTEGIKKVRILKKLGVDCIDYIPFTKQYAQTSAFDFLKSFLIDNFHPYAIVTGYDTRFGHNREGDIKFLIEHANEFDYQVIQTNIFTMQNSKIISSSLIRDLIRHGLIENAQSYLGYYYSILGNVVGGKQLGRTMGFPTININPIEKNKLIPGHGVYITLCRIYEPKDSFSSNDNAFHICVTNIGTSPSVKIDSKMTVESHLINFTGDLYEKDVELFFLARIRDEIKFESKELLIKQIESDVIKTIDYFTKFNDWNKLW